MIDIDDGNDGRLPPTLCLFDLDSVVAKGSG